MKCKILIYSAIAAMVAAPLASALAADIPRLNPERYCNEVAQAGGGSAMIRNGCIEMEQNAYNKLKGYWSALPATARNYCVEVAQAGGGSYSILSGCVDMEVEAAGSGKSFKY